MNVAISSIKKKELKEWRKTLSGCVEKHGTSKWMTILRNLDMKNFLKFSPVLDAELYDSWRSITVIVLSCSSNEGGGLFLSATDWFLRRFNHSFPVLSLLLALLWPLLSWSLFSPQHIQNRVLSALLERGVLNGFPQMWALSHSWWELCVPLDVRIRLWICELCCACLTVSGDGALFAYN